jgi:succinyl-CoA synthetase alpha subunit
MAIVVDHDTRLVVQGITGREGSFHATRNKAYGTNVVAGVTPGKGGAEVEGIPVFDSVRAAAEETSPNTAMVFVPARFAADAIYEAVDAGIETVICITEGIPAHDMLRVYNYIRPRGVTLIGPNCPGVLSPGKANVGIIPAAHVPDRARTDATRYRPVDYRWNWGGPRRRVVVFGRPRPLRGRLGDRVRGHGRGDRRRRGGEGGPIH